MAEGSNVLGLEGTMVPGSAARVMAAARVGVEQPVLAAGGDLLRAWRRCGRRRRAAAFPRRRGGPERERRFLLGERARRSRGTGPAPPRLPRDAGAAEDVDDAVAGGEPKVKEVALCGRPEAEPGPRRRRGRAAEVELHGVVDLVVAHPVRLRDVEVAVGREGAGEAPEQPRQRRPQLRREHGVQHPLQERQRAHEGRQHRPVLLHRRSPRLSPTRPGLGGRRNSREGGWEPTET
uniref:Uncharacterized protein n=1 Tax=Triticum urartu TaxID=4572 RepID=A0A8R7UIG2_TRIUA